MTTFSIYIRIIQCVIDDQHVCDVYGWISIIQVLKLMEDEDVKLEVGIIHRTPWEIKPFRTSDCINKAYNLVGSMK